MQHNPVCLQCNKISSTPTNRLVQDSCGHTKCRSCLLNDIEDCKQCSFLHKGMNIQSNGIDNLLPKLPNNRTGVIHCNGKSKGSDDTREEFPNDIAKKHEVDNTSDKSSGKSKMEIPRHIAVNLDPMSFLCTICGKTFFTKFHVKYHKFCAGGEKPFKCTLCQKEFILNAQLEVHMHRHSNEKPFKCESCPKEFSEKSKLSRHMMLHTSRKSFICSTCAKSFKTKDSLRIHSLIHKTERPFACKICDVKFSNSSNLQKHMATHSDEKVHMCDQCGRRFKLKWALTVHRKSHQNIRHHSCNVCSKTFISNKDLQRHILTHSDTKNFTCGICGTSFRRKDNLHRHMKNSHPGKKGDIIKHPTSDFQVPKKSVVVIDNPNAVNVITASPAIATKSKVGGMALPTDLSSSTDSRPGGSVINGPIKLAFKTPAFKSNYNITGGRDIISSASTKTTEPSNYGSPTPLISIAELDRYKSEENVSRSPLPQLPPSHQSLSSYSSVLHYGTAFQNRKHAMIKNIKFKVPEQYTNSFKSNLPNDNGNRNINDSTSVIVNSSEVQWGNKFTQNEENSE